MMRFFFFDEVGFNFNSNDLYHDLYMLCWNLRENINNKVSGGQ